MKAELLKDAARAGVFHLEGEPRDVAAAAEAAGLAAIRIDIHHAHDKGDFINDISRALAFPPEFGNNWDALADSLKDLSWKPAPGWVVILEKSKHFCAAHRHEFEEAMGLMGEIADYWRGEGKPFWTLIGGPEGWESGWPKPPAA